MTLSIILAILNIVVSIPNVIIALKLRNWHSAAGWVVSCLGWTVVILTILDK